MSVSFNISSHRTRFLLLCALTVSGLAGQGRPIEFSEPSSSESPVNVSSLGIKPAELPGVEERVFKPHKYTPERGLSSNMKPLTKQPGFSSRPNKRTPGMFDREKSWLELTPQEMLETMMERESIRLPAYGNRNKSWDASDPYSLPSARRTGTETRRPARETNRVDSATAALGANDPFTSFSGRRSLADLPASLDLNVGRPRNVADWLPSDDTFSPNGRRERTEPAGRLEEFRRNPAFQTPGAHPGWANPTATPGRGNNFVTEVENASRSPAGSAPSLFVTPAAPVAPSAPLAPGQTSLTPAPYTPPAKSKPANISAPRRSL